MFFFLFCLSTYAAQHLSGMFENSSSLRRLVDDGLDMTSKENQNILKRVRV